MNFSARRSPLTFFDTLWGRKAYRRLRNPRKKAATCRTNALRSRNKSSPPNIERRDRGKKSLSRNWNYWEVNGSLLFWSASFIVSGVQAVKYENSGNINVISGIPRASRLIPLLSNFFINNISGVSRSPKFPAFRCADNFGIYQYSR